MTYRSYKGRGVSRRNKLIIALCCLVLLLTAAVVAFFVAQEFIVFTSDGFSFRFPWQQEETPPQNDPLKESDLSGVIFDIPEPQDPPKQNDSSNGSTSSTQDAAYTGALLADAAQLLQQSQRDALIAQLSSESRINSIAVSVKGSDGIWLLPSDAAYYTDLPDAQGRNANALAEAAMVLNNADIRTVAIVSALKDNLAPRNFRQIGVQTENGVTWLDRQYISWIDPYAQDTAAYLKAVIDACFEAGFDEIVLDNFQFVTAGKTELIRYRKNNLSPAQALTTLAQELADHAAARGVALSLLVTDTAAATGMDAAAGQDLALLAPHFHCLYAYSTITDTISNTGLLLPQGQNTAAQRNFILYQP